MALYVRMGLYLLFGVIAGNGLGVYDQAAGTITFNVNDLEPLITGIVGYGATFVWSRVAKAKGGKT